MLAIAPGWELAVERGPDWLIVTVKGSDEDRDESPPLADRLWELLGQHLTHRLVLELHDVPILTSHLIGQLINLYRRIREQDGVMRLCGLSAYNRNVLHTCHLDDRLPSYDDPHEAVLGYAERPKPR
jgi:anti-anti-sigma factor